MSNDKTIEHYNKIVEEYWNTNKENGIVGKQREIFSNNIPGGKILDLGCGFGRDTHAFSNAGLECLGVDASRSMIEKAKSLFPTDNFRIMNMLKEEINSNYDGVWCCASLLHFNPEELEEVLGKIVNSLKRNGVFYCSMKTDSVSYVYEDLERVFFVYTKEELEVMFNKFPLTLFYYEENKSKDGKIFSSFFFKKD